MRRNLGLFKGKCEDGQWRMGYYYGTAEDGKPKIIDCKWENVYKVKFGSLCGYTGLEADGVGDFDGRALIFEGDILELKDTSNDICWRAVVRFGNPNGLNSWGWQLMPLGKADVNPDILLWVGTELENISCKIIGNAIDNRELFDV